MRFKKGIKVEVLSKRDVPSGAWRSAEIISGNGRYYTVRYERYADAAGETERISRKAIRPFPPPLDVSEHWVPGDVVEVFDNFSWRMATVSKVLGGEYFWVRLLGSSLEFRASKPYVRVRQSWQDDGWIVIGKGSGSCGEPKHGDLTLKCKAHLGSQVQKKKLRIKLNVKGDRIPLENEANFKGSDVSSAKTSKRRCSSQVEAYAGTAQKFRAVEKHGRLDRTMPANQLVIPDQVNEAAFPRKMIGRKYTSNPIENRTNRFSEMPPERRKRSHTCGYSSAENLEWDDADSVTSSVGSCGIGSSGFYYVTSSPVEDLDGHSSDAESFCGSCSEDKFVLPTKKDTGAETPRSELLAYRCTIERLHASGPITWEQEAWITNLRLSLNISNDEHLTEIRNLISADNSLSVR